VRAPAIYVEYRIAASMDDLWAATQSPGQHQRWDVRFGSIDYQPAVEGEPQRFTYATTVAPGFTVAGTGESLGDRNRPDGSRWSGLKFWADDRRSLIAAGAGYWRYIPTDEGIRFITRYDYRTRWGPFGAGLDRVMFRPLFGWATAWSFDRLRLWLEEGIEPEAARNRSLIHASATIGLWIVATQLLIADRVRLATSVVAMAGLATVAAVTHSRRPSGRRPLRVAPDRQPEVGVLP
jgi:hypothetical protein